MLLDSLNAGASLRVTETVTIYDGGKNKMLKAINALGTESAKKDALAEYYNILDAADSAYYAVLEAEANLEVQKAALKITELSLSTTEVRYENKMISRGDYLQALSEKESAEMSKRQAERNITISMARLKNIIGVKENFSLEAIDFTAYEDLIKRCAAIDDAALNAVYAKLWTIMQANNISIAKAAISVDRAGKNVDLAKKDYLPSLSASFSTGIGYQYNSSQNGLTPFLGGVSLGLKIPLDFWTTKNKMDKQKISQEQTQLSYEDTLASAEIDAQTALLNLITQAGSIISARRAYEYAQEHLHYIQELYMLSQKSLSDFSNAASLEIRSRNALISAQFGFLESLSKIRSLGTFSDEAAIIALLME
jgi:outer membrane protein TolC